MMPRSLRLLSAAGVLVAAISTGALAQSYMGSPAYPYPAPAVTGPNYYSYSAPYENHYSPYGSASPYINNARPEGSGTNPYVSGVGTSGHAPLR
jgi:hypothetical protein